MSIQTTNENIMFINRSYISPYISGLSKYMKIDYLTKHKVYTLNEYDTYNILMYATYKAFNCDNGLFGCINDIRDDYTDNYGNIFTKIDFADINQITITITDSLLTLSENNTNIMFKEILQKIFVDYVNMSKQNEENVKYWKQFGVNGIFDIIVMLLEAIQYVLIYKRFNISIDAETERMKIINCYNCFKLIETIDSNCDNIKLCGTFNTNIMDNIYNIMLKWSYLFKYQLPILVVNVQNNNIYGKPYEYIYKCIYEMIPKYYILPHPKGSTITLSDLMELLKCYIRLMNVSSTTYIESTLTVKNVNKYSVYIRSGMYKKSKIYMCIGDFQNMDEKLELKFIMHYCGIVSDNYNFQICDFKKAIEEYYKNNIDAINKCIKENNITMNEITTLYILITSKTITENDKIYSFDGNEILMKLEEYINCAHDLNDIY